MRLHHSSRAVFFGAQRNTWYGNRLVRSNRAFGFPANLANMPAFGAAYILRAIIVHTGSAVQGHYTAYCRRGHGWIHCDDESVQRANLQTVLSQTRSVYLLAYEKDV